MIDAGFGLLKLEIYKLINQLKRENMNFQPYCLLKSLIEGKPYRIWNYSPNYTEQESICLQLGRLNTCKNVTRKALSFQIVDCCQGIDIFMA